MKTAIVLFVSIPLTAALSAGGTVVALKHLDQRAGPPPPQAATESTTATTTEQSSPLAPLPAAVHLVPAIAPAVVAPITDSVADTSRERDTETDPGTRSDADIEAPPTIEADTGPVRDAETETDTNAAPDTETDTGANALGIDYLRLTEDIHRISDALERFNRKLTDRLVGPSAAPASADGASIVTPKSGGDSETETETEQG